MLKSILDRDMCASAHSMMTLAGDMTVLQANDADVLNFLQVLASRHECLSDAGAAHAWSREFAVQQAQQDQHQRQQHGPQPSGAWAEEFQRTSATVAEAPAGPADGASWAAEFAQPSAGATAMSAVLQEPAWTSVQCSHLLSDRRDQN